MGSAAVVNFSLQVFSVLDATGVIRTAIYRSMIIGHYCYTGLSGFLQQLLNGQYSYCQLVYALYDDGKVTWFCMFCRLPVGY